MQQRRKLRRCPRQPLQYRPRLPPSKEKREIRATPAHLAFPALKAKKGAQAQQERRAPPVPLARTALLVLLGLKETPGPPVLQVPPDPLALKERKEGPVKPVHRQKPLEAE